MFVNEASKTNDVINLMLLNKDSHDRKYYALYPKVSGGT
jgi:hypothetical protein